MSSSGQHTAFVYLDIRNIQGSAAKYYGQDDLHTVNLSRVVESVVRGERDLALQDIRAYTGIPPLGKAKERSEGILFLDRLKTLGVKTFANELARDSVGRLHENGIDLKISADMALDFLKNPNAKTFMVFSNDTDYESSFQLLRDMAKITGREIDCVSITSGGRRGARNARSLEVSPELFNRYCSDTDTLTTDAARRLKRDPEKALDLSPHHVRSALVPPEVSATKELKTGCYIDANSLGKTAKQLFDRKYLDINLGGLLNHVGQDRNRPPACATMFMSTHDPKFSLVDSLLVREIGAAAGRSRLSVVSVPFFYNKPTIGRDMNGPGSAVPISATVPNEKNIETNILRSVVMDMLTKKRVQDVVIVSDRSSLWPIGDVVKELSKVTGASPSVTNVHFGEKAIDGMESVPISRDTYKQFLFKKDMLKEAQLEASDLVLNERDDMLKALKTQHPRHNIVIEPDKITGVVSVVGSYVWNAVDDGNGTIALISKMPMVPESGVVYTFSKGSMSRAHPSEIERLDVLLKSQKLEKSSSGVLPPRNAYSR